VAGEIEAAFGHPLIGQRIGWRAGEGGEAGGTDLDVSAEPLQLSFENGRRHRAAADIASAQNEDASEREAVRYTFVTLEQRSHPVFVAGFAAQFPAAARSSASSRDARSFSLRCASLRMERISSSMASFTRPSSRSATAMW